MSTGSVSVVLVRVFVAVLSAIIHAVVASCVVFVPAAAVGAVGVHVNAGLTRGANNATAQSNIALAVRYTTLLVVLPVIVVALFATDSGVYQKLFSPTAQFVLVCPGVLINALTVSHDVTATHHSVPATDTVQIFHFLIAPAVPLHHVDGYKLVDASWLPLSFHRLVTSASAYANISVFFEVGSYISFVISPKLYDVLTLSVST